MLGEDSLSALTKGERLCGLFKRDESFFFCDLLLSLSGVFVEGGDEKFFDDFSEDAFFPLFGVLSDESEGLPLFLREDHKGK